MAAAKELVARTAAPSTDHQPQRSALADALRRCAGHRSAAVRRSLVRPSRLRPGVVTWRVGVPLSAGHATVASNGHADGLRIRHACLLHPGVDEPLLPLDEGASADLYHCAGDHGL